MKRCDHYNGQLHVRVLYVSTVLMSMMVLFNTFVSIYILLRFDNRTGPPDAQRDYSVNRKADTDKGRVAKRDVSWENEMNCGDDGSNDDDSIRLTGSCRIQKSALLEYCFRAEDFCRSKASGIKGEEKEKKEEKRREDCYINEISGKQKIDLFYDVEFEFCMFDPFQDPPGGEFSFWIHNRTGLFEYRVSDNLTDITIRKNYTRFNEDWPIDSGIVYNGSFFYQYKEEKKIVKANLTTMTVIKEKQLEVSSDRKFPISIFWFFSDEFSLWVVYKIYDIEKLVCYRINPETLDILSTHNFTLTGFHPAMGFVAFGKLYFVDYERDSVTATIYPVADLFGYKFENVSSVINVTSYVMRVIYDWRSRHLFLDEFGTLFRYKVYFRCSNKSGSLDSS